MPDYHALPGIPLRTHVKTSNEHEITSTIESISVSPLPDTDFTVPAATGDENARSSQRQAALHYSVKRRHA
jgi:hypothetical protein